MRLLLWQNTDSLILSNILEMDWNNSRYGEAKTTQTLTDISMRKLFVIKI